MKRKMTPFARIALAVIGVAAVYFGINFLSKTGVAENFAPSGKQAASSGKFSFGGSKRDKDTIRVGVVTWGGYAGGQYFNEGFRASEQSRFYRDYGIKVEFVLNDDFNSSRDAWKADQIDLLWITADSFPTEVDALKEFDPKIVFQADWSRGGDAIVVRRGINNANDLRGKKIAVAYGTPSHTFLIWMLNAADISYNEIDVVQTGSAVDAAAMFKSGNVDAAVVWSPDDEDCVAAIQGAKILKNTKEASHIIADVFYAKSSFIDSHREQLKGLIEGWMIGNAEINSKAEAKRKAIRILTEGLNVAPDFAEKALGNVRLATLGDNKAFFGLASSTTPKGETIYSSMATNFASINAAPGRVPNWRSITDTSIISSIQLNGAIHAAEGGVKFSKPSESLADAPAFSSKQVSISFPTNSATLSDDAKYTIQNKFVDIAKSFARSRIRIEGNTDSTGNPEMNKILSFRRAQAVADFLAREYRFDPNRFVVVGNGQDKPIADNNSDTGRSKNRRTDFELISE